MKIAPLKSLCFLCIWILLLCISCFGAAAESECVWSEWIVDTQPTCSEIGHKHRVCILDANAPHTETAIIPMLPHEYEITETPPTCTQVGLRTYTCISCSDSYTEEFGAYAEHQYGRSVTEPSCTAEGAYTYTCSVCGDTYTEAIPMTEHTYTAAILREPDCQSVGKIQYECTACHDTYTEAYGTLQKHTYEELTEETDEYRITYLVCRVCGERHEQSREKIVHIEKSEPKEEASLLVENTVMNALNVAAVTVFAVVLVPDFKVLIWHRKLKQAFLKQRFK